MGLTERLGGFYRSEDETWNCRLDYDGAVVPTCEGTLELMKDAGTNHTGYISFFTLKDGTAQQPTDTKIVVELAGGSQGGQIGGSTPGNAPSTITSPIKTADGKVYLNSNEVTFYKAGKFTSAQHPDAWTFFLRINGKQYKFLPGSPDLSKTVAGCQVPAGPSSITTPNPVICNLGGAMDLAALADTTPYADSSFSGPGANSGPPNKPLPPTPGTKTKDPPGQNVMLVVLLLGAVLALSNCMPCK